MKMSEAMSIINGKPKSKGYMVSFDELGDNFWRSNYFPEKHQGEELIPTEEEAWELARAFAEKSGDKYRNIYVVDAGFFPVKGYEKKKIKAP